MIKLIDVSKSYKTKHSNNFVLSNINHEFSCGTINTIYGNSGTGKTTFLNLAGLIDQPSSGSIYINDEQVLFNKDLSNYRMKYFGFIFQDHYLLPEFTVLENLQLPQVIKNGKKYSKEKIYNLLDQFNLSNLLNEYPGRISMGEAQRVAILRATINNPKIIIADEPTSNLDQFNAELVVKLFNALQKDFGHTIIIATHDKRFLDISNNSYKLDNKNLIEI